MKRLVGVLMLAVVLVAMSSGVDALPTRDLQFTFSSEESPWTPEDLGRISQWIGDFYPEAKLVYGSPAFNTTVNVRKNPDSGPFSWTSGGVYEIVLPGTLSPDAFLHEMLHMFRGRLTILNAAFEEGMVRAAEVAVMNRRPTYEYYNRHHGYAIDVYYESNNQSSISAPGGNFFAGFNPFLRYQQAGYACTKILLERPTFLADFNRMYYARVRRNASIRSNVAVLKSIAGYLAPRVEGRRFNAWFARQKVFSFNPGTGYQIFFKRDSQNFYVFHRDENGAEVMLADIPYRWEAFDAFGILLGSGSGVTGPGGWDWIRMDFPVGYLTRTRHVLAVSLPDGQELVKEFISSNANLNDQVGLFGIVVGQTNGTVTITGAGGFRDEVLVVNGTFVSMAAGELAGRFLLTFQGEDGAVIKKFVTKDAAPYWVALGM